MNTYKSIFDVGREKLVIKHHDRIIDDTFSIAIPGRLIDHLEDKQIPENLFLWGKFPFVDGSTKEIPLWFKSKINPNGSMRQNDHKYELYVSKQFLYNKKVDLTKNDFAPVSDVPTKTEVHVRILNSRNWRYYVYWALKTRTGRIETLKFLFALFSTIASFILTLTTTNSTSDTILWIIIIWGSALILHSIISFIVKLGTLP